MLRPQTFFKFVPSNRTIRSITYEFGLNEQKKGFYFYFTDIENIHHFEHSVFGGDHIMIIKIPTHIPLMKEKEDIDYFSPSIFVESIHSYSDFLKDDTICTDLKKNMERIDLRMPMHQTKENCLKVVKKNGSIWHIIFNIPSFLDKEVCLAAVQTDTKYIEDIVHPDVVALLDIQTLKEVCLAAVKKDSYIIRFIHNSTVPEKLDAQSLKEIYLIAVQNRGDAIKFIKDSPIIDKEVCLAPVKQNDRARIYIKDFVLT